MANGSWRNNNGIWQPYDRGLGFAQFRRACLARAHNERMLRLAVAHGSAQRVGHLAQQRMARERLVARCIAWACLLVILACLGVLAWTTWAP